MFKGLGNAEKRILSIIEPGVPLTITGAREVYPETDHKTHRQAMHSLARKGSEVKVFDTVTKEKPEQKAARLEQEKREREQARARHARYNKTEARKISNKTYEKTPAGKAVKAVKEKAREERAKERRLIAPFWGIDGEGVSMHEAAWIEDEKYAPTPPLKPRPPVLEINARVASRAFGEGVIQSFDKAAGVAIIKFDDDETTQNGSSRVNSPGSRRGSAHQSE